MSRQTPNSFSKSSWRHALASKWLLRTFHLFSLRALHSNDVNGHVALLETSKNHKQQIFKSRRNQRQIKYFKIRKFQQNVQHA